MSAQDESPEKWINPLLEKLDLVHPKRIPVDLRLLWAELEEYGVPERIRAAAANINQQAGYHVINLLDYLPPQRCVVRVVYRKNKFEFVMAVVLRSGGTAVTFQSSKTPTAGWGRYIPGRSKSREYQVEIIRGFRPAEITDKIVQNWFSFLLSGLSKEFQLGLNQQPPLSGELRPNTLFRKQSAS